MSAFDAAKRVEELRRQFDEAFARPPADAPETEDLLRTDGCLVRLGQLASIHKLPEPEPVPGAREGLLGIVAIKGQLVPVFSLARMLQRPVPSERTESRESKWMLVAAGPEPVGFAVDAVDGVARVTKKDVAAGALPDGSPLLDLGALADRIRNTERGR